MNVIKYFGGKGMLAPRIHANHAAGGDGKRVMIECLWKNW